MTASLSSRYKNMSMKIKFFTAAISSIAVFALSGMAIAQTKKPQAPAPKTEQKTPEAQQDAPPPRGPEGFRPRMGPGPRGEMGFRQGPAQDRGMRRGKMNGKRGIGGPGMMFLGLGLTDDQKSKIQAIMKAAKPSDAQREEMRSLMMSARTGLLTDAQQARMKAVRDERMAKRDGIRSQVMGVLTPEQKGKLEERRFNQMRRNKMQRGPQQRRGRIEQRGPGRGPAGPGRERRQGPPPPPRQ